MSYESFMKIMSSMIRNKLLLNGCLLWKFKAIACEWNIVVLDITFSH